MRREDYKAIKHMDKARMEQCLNSVYRRGYEDGVKAMAEQLQAKGKDAQAMEG